MNQPKDESVLLSIVRTSNIHQYAECIFWGTNAECDAERERLDPDFKHGLKVARQDEAHRFTY